ncbi:hypothetical protein JZ751_005245 [Albula glossodonta]|uniref:Uncharacterized protein n=1 Tax=Albula glossodonta TaxID=121402 RepID=A0A8T2PDF2_9TELE|nr:hypothetical protein JZ751_005245 [Albula glossodonta]
MVRSKSRTHSSRSQSRSHSSSRSRSRSRSRKKRYSSRSRSRSYSRSRSRDRNYPRDYRRDYRMNRGMRRPYGFRNRGRGYYPGGGGRFHHRGGFRPNWYNRHYSRSPRRGRSRSRTPKRRSTSQRSHSKSPLSSASHRTSSSSSSYSRSPTDPKRQGLQDKVGKKAEEAEQGVGKDDQQANPELKRPALMSDGWISISAYDNGSPRLSPSPATASGLPGQSSNRPEVLTASGISLPLQSSVQPRSKQRSPNAALEQHSPYHSPVNSTPGRSPGPTFPTPTSSRGMFLNSDKQDLQKLGKLFKRYLEEGNGRNFIQERGDGELQQDKVQEEGEWVGMQPELGVKKKAEKVPFLGDSPEAEEEEDESQAYRQPYQYRLSNQGEPVKNYPGESHWTVDGQDEIGKYKTKSSKAGRELDRFGDDRVCKFKDPSYVLDRSGKDKYAEEDKGMERHDDKPAGKRETHLLQQVKADRLRELITQGPLLQKTVDVRDKGCIREETPLRVRLAPSEGPRPEVKMKIPLCFENASPGTSLTSDRSLASALAQSSRKEQGFRSIFDHIKRPQAFKTSAESYIHHIVSLVHHVRGHGSPGICIELPSPMLQCNYT